MFMGEYHHNIDDKNRLIIPSKFREQLGDKCVITRGLDNCLFIYPNNTWEKIISKLNDIPFTKKDSRNFNRFFLSGASTLEFDKQGRINVSSTLKDYSFLEKECVLIGVGDRVELWSSTKWDEFLNNNADSMSDIAEGLFNDSN